LSKGVNGRKRNAGSRLRLALESSFNQVDEAVDQKLMGLLNACRGLLHVGLMKLL
jgi:hypothetical protein